MKIEKRTHEFFGTTQYICSSKNGKISLIEFPSNIYPDLKDLRFEILCIEGNLLDGVERFKTKEEAMKRIKELLEGD